MPNAIAIRFRLRITKGDDIAVGPGKIDLLEAIARTGSITSAAKELGIMPTTEGGLDQKLNLTHGIDGYPGIEHTLPITPKFEDIFEWYKATQVTNSPTLIVEYGDYYSEK